MFISSAGPRVVLNGGPNAFVFTPSSIEEQLLCQHLQLGFGFDLHGGIMAGHGFDAWSNGMRAKAEPDDDWFHDRGNGGVLGCPTQDSYVGMNPILGGGGGGNCVKNDYQPTGPVVSAPALGRDLAGDPSFVGRPMPEDDGFWGPPPSMDDDGMSTMMAAQARWASLQNPLPYVPHGLPVPLVDMNIMAVAGDAAEFPAVTAPNSVYGSFSSTGASEMMDSMSLSHDGSSSPWTPAAQRSEQVATGMSNDAWVMSQNMNTTVSPKMLKLNPTPTPPSSSSESVHTSFLSFGPAETPQDVYEAGMPAPTQAQLGGSSNCKPRTLLPDRPRWIPILPSDRPGRTQGAKAKSPERGRRHIQKPGGHKASKTKGKKPTDSHHHEEGPAVVPQPEIAVQDIDASLEEERNRRDAFLVQNKRAGMTYKEIRLKGGFTEAESTLRGRFRTLTKNKEQRVRKPEWEEKDDRLLRKAVRRLAKGEPITNTKIPWKLVAEYIVDNGGSYHFGNTTCRKRWDYLATQDRTEGK